MKWPSGMGRVLASVVQTLGLWIVIPHGKWMSYKSAAFIATCVGRGLVISRSTLQAVPPKVYTGLTISENSSDLEEA